MIAGRSPGARIKCCHFMFFANHEWLHICIFPTYHIKVSEDTYARLNRSWFSHLASLSLWQRRRIFLMRRRNYSNPVCGDRSRYSLRDVRTTTWKYEMYKCHTSMVCSDVQWQHFFLPFGLHDDFGATIRMINGHGKSLPSTLPHQLTILCRSVDV